MYLTFRRYVDNYFAHSAKNIVICSFWGWEYYTNFREWIILYTSIVATIYPADKK